MSKYKLIAFDMDGTLLNSQKILPQCNINAIKKAVEQDKIVILSTGRCLPQLEDFVDIIPNLRYLNCLSGACVYDLKEHKTISSKYIDEETALKIIDCVKGRDVMLELLTEHHFIQKDNFEILDRFGMGVYKELYGRKAEMLDNIVDWYTNSPFPLGKLNIYHKNPKERDLTFNTIKSKNIKISPAYAEITSLEMSANGVDKGFGLEKLCEHLKIDINDTIAVGDADNDIGIFKKAGLKIAMDNANNTIKSLADVVVSDCDNGGCVEAIENYLL